MVGGRREEVGGRREDAYHGKTITLTLNLRGDEGKMYHD